MTGRAHQYSTGSVSDLNPGECPFTEAQVAHAPGTARLTHQLPIIESSNTIVGLTPANDLDRTIGMRGDRLRNGAEQESLPSSIPV